MPEISVVVPVRDEAENIAPLLGEIAAVMRGGPAFEILYVDDASDDATPTILAMERERYPELRWLRLSENRGQSAAVRTGVLHARGAIIVTLDGDGQNVPADISALLALYWREAAAGRVTMIAGRRRRRQDDALRRLAGRLANRVRGAVLGDGAEDTGCGLKVFGREAFLRLPYFDHMHRFLPALMRREGYDVFNVDVGHRPRLRGRSKYGVFDRLWVGIVDLFGVLWLKRRSRPPPIITEQPDPGAARLPPNHLVK